MKILENIQNIVHNRIDVEIIFISKSFSSILFTEWLGLSIVFLSQFGILSTTTIKFCMEKYTRLNAFHAKLKWKQWKTPKY